MLSTNKIETTIHTSKAQPLGGIPPSPGPPLRKSPTSWKNVHFNSETVEVYHFYLHIRKSKEWRQVEKSDLSPIKNSTYRSTTNDLFHHQFGVQCSVPVYWILPAAFSLESTGCQERTGSQRTCVKSECRTDLDVLNSIQLYKWFAKHDYTRV